MQIIISKNKKLDKQMIRVFFAEGNPYLLDSWPELKTVKEILAAAEEEYGKELDDKIIVLRNKKKQLLSITEAISEVMGEGWDPINKIYIYLGVCPIAPRFLEHQSCLLPYYQSTDILLNWSAHEMIHFLYFKRWAQIFPEHKAEYFEYPHPVWALSEILVANIGNDKRIQGVVNSDFNIYPHWQGIKINKKTLSEIFGKIYENSLSFDDFLEKSWEKYQSLDKKHALTKKLI